MSGLPPITYPVIRLSLRQWSRAAAAVSLPVGSVLDLYPSLSYTSLAPHDAPVIP